MFSVISSSMSIWRNTSWSRQSLLVKGLILLSVPLFVQLGLGVVLLQLQQEAELEVHRANEARTIETEINCLVADSVQLMLRSQTVPESKWRVQGYKGFLTPESSALLHEVMEKYKSLDALTKNKPDWNGSVKRSFAPVKSLAEIIDQADKLILAGKVNEVVATRDEMSERLSTIGNQFVSQELYVMAKKEEDLAKISTARQADIRQTAVKYAAVLILANMVFAVLLAVFLVRTMTSRLAAMADNAVKLAAHEPLNAPLSGEDEIVELDHVFHKMAEAIDQSARDKQDLYNIVTQDLRTPIITIQGCLEKLDQQQDEEFSARATKLISVASRNSARTIGLLNDLLDSQKVEDGQIDFVAATVSLQSIFDDVSQDLSGWIEETGIQISFANTDFEVNANRDMLSRILFNLLSNAIKYSPRGGTIVIGVRPVSTMVEITVRDQGPGIAEHMLKAVFDRFRQVSSSDPVSRRGSGLGLAICQDFVHLHGGEIWVTSQVGQGSSFHFTVPLA